MSGFYSKMLINIRSLYFNKANSMKIILHDIFSDAASVFLEGYAPSHCEENEFVPIIQKFINKFGSETAGEVEVTEETIASAMCNPAALVAMMHDPEFAALKEAFYYAWALNISDILTDDENNGNVIGSFYVPDTGSEECSDGEDSLIFGYAEPEKIAKFAESIPKQIVDSAEYLIKSAHVENRVLYRDFLENTLKNPTASRNLQNAFAMLNGNFTSDSPVCCYTNGYTHGMADVYDIEDVRKHPEDYAVIELLFHD